MQINSDDGLKLIPLFDVSDTLGFQCDKVLGPESWYGAIYYNILLHEQHGKKFYTLFGFDANDYWSNKKFIEILTFENHKPVFGAPLIYVTDSTGKTTIYNRYFIEYKHNTEVGMNYYADRDMIVFDHLEPYKEKYRGLYFTYIPDGSYEGFKWEDGKWDWIKKVFHYSIGKNDDPPVPKPVLDGEQKKLYESKSPRKTN